MSDTMREALEKAAKQFRFYEREHHQKAMAFAKREDAGGHVTSLGKARTNREFAEMCEAALKQEGVDERAEQDDAASSARCTRCGAKRSAATEGQYCSGSLQLPDTHAWPATTSQATQKGDGWRDIEQEGLVAGGDAYALARRIMTLCGCAPASPSLEPGACEITDKVVAMLEGVECAAAFGGKP
jgi:hypothetical protein